MKLSLILAALAIMLLAGCTASQDRSGPAALTGDSGVQGQTASVSTTDASEQPGYYKGGGWRNSRP